MQVNLDKSNLCAKTIEFLSFLLMQTGHQPTHQQIKAILKIACPQYIKKGSGFLGTINFIKYHFPNKAELLQPITELTKEDAPFIWGEKQGTAFDRIKASVSNAILCTYPDPSK